MSCNGLASEILPNCRPCSFLNLAGRKRRVRRRVAELSRPTVTVKTARMYDPTEAKASLRMLCLWHLHLPRETRITKVV